MRMRRTLHRDYNRRTCRPRSPAVRQVQKKGAGTGSKKMVGEEPRVYETVATRQKEIRMINGKFLLLTGAAFWVIVLVIGFTVITIGKGC